MSASIVYEGVAAQNGGGGDLFSGLNFWIAQRVPSRHDCILNIQNNGGTVVPLERNADMLIADSSRADAPVGSYSYHLIRDALRDGSLDKKETYRCKAPSQPAAPISNSAQPKATRSRFTKDDDEMLLKFVTEQFQKGEGLNGNKIYVDLAEKHPHHTMHSWRDRWLKKLRPLHSDASLRSRHEQSTLLKSPNPAESGGSGTSTPKPHKFPNPPESEESGTSTPKRLKFTPLEDNALRSFIEDMKAGGNPIRGTQLYKDFAVDFPQRSWQSWRSRARLFSFWEPRSDADQRPTDGHALKSQEGHAPSGPIKRSGHVEGSGQQDSLRSPSVASAETPATGQKHTSVPEKADQEPYEAKASPERDGENAELVFQGGEATNGDLDHADSEHQLRPDHSYEHVDSGEVIRRSSFSSAPIAPHDSESIKNPYELLQTGTQGQFYNDFSDFREERGLGADVFPTVQGRVIELWPLWQAVVSKKVDPSERDWHQIAEELGFDWIQHERVPEELRRCYEENLGGFEQELLSFEMSDDDGEDKDTEGEEHESTFTEKPMPSSPPVRPSLKRALRDIEPLGPPYMHSSPKRQRRDRDSEIQSTPDEVNGTSRLRRSTDIDKSPTARRSGRAGPSQPSSPRGNRQIAMTDEGNNEMRDEAHELPVLPHPRSRVTEPETQDFAYDPETQRMGVDSVLEDAEYESQINTTPSQQLRQESDAWSSPPTVTKLTFAPRPAAWNPFHEVESEDGVRGMDNAGKLVKPQPQPNAHQPSRRSLPKGWRKKSPCRNASATLSPPRQTARASSGSPPEGQQPRRTRAPAEAEEDTPDEIIERFVMLGYSHDIVVRALRATTWHIGNAGQVMEMLKRGDDMPERTSGVWTARDDESLALVDDSEERPADAADAEAEKKRERKRARALKRLQAKHGADGIERRRRYLSS
ncbi:hypothetical protein GGR56DRAFT_637928 [Xylariaceae sp. FL0804]|nr:hypothetical protein GGR56DRAFT_637928 [Xylariaceae sp. FL0804]